VDCSRGTTVGTCHIMGAVQPDGWRFLRRSEIWENMAASVQHGQRRKAESSHRLCLVRRIGHFTRQDPRPSVVSISQNRRKPDSSPLRKVLCIAHFCHIGLGCAGGGERNIGVLGVFPFPSERIYLADKRALRGSLSKPSEFCRPRTVLGNSRNLPHNTAPFYAYRPVTPRRYCPVAYMRVEMCSAAIWVQAADPEG